MCTFMLLLCLPVKSWGIELTTETHELGCESAKVEWTQEDLTAQWHELRTIFIDGLAFQYSEEFAIMMPKQTALVPRPRSGHSEIEVRSCRFGTGEEEVHVCSVWTNSAVSGVPNPWNVFWKPLAPTDIIIEDE